MALKPDIAISKMDMATPLLKNKQDKAWNYSSLAYAYQQKYISSDKEDDKKQALLYSDKVISELYPNAKNEPVAFAYYIRGLIQYDTENYSDAETDLKKSLTIYETIRKRKSNHYAQVKNILATVILDQDGRDKEAITLFEQVDRYWRSKDNFEQNPYAAKNLISLGEAYLKIDNAKNACDELKQAITILQNIYGNNTELLVEPYELLSDTYEILGDAKLATAYEEKASKLSKG